MTKLFIALEGVKQIRDRNQLYFEGLHNQNKITRSYYEYLSHRNKMCYKSLKHNGIYDEEKHLFIPITSSSNSLRFSITFEEFIRSTHYTYHDVIKFNEKCYVSRIVWSLKENKELKIINIDEDLNIIKHQIGDGTQLDKLKADIQLLEKKDFFIKENSDFFFNSMSIKHDFKNEETQHKLPVPEE